MIISLKYIMSINWKIIFIPESIIAIFYAVNMI